MRNVQLEKVFLLSYSNLYNEAFDPATALKGLPQKAALEFTSYLLHLFNVRKREDNGFHSRHLIQWMMQMSSAAQQKLMHFIEQEKDTIFSPSFQLITRRPCLDLIQHLLVYSPATDHSLKREHFTTLFKCLLHFNAKENKTQEQLFNRTENTEQFANQILAVQVCNTEHERFKDYVLQFLKVYYFFEFCEAHPKYAVHVKTFLQSLKLNSYRTYLWKLINPFLLLMVNEKPTPKMYIDDGGEVMNFYERLIINGKIEAVDQDYKPLREYPLFHTEKNTYLFLDFRFFIDKFYQGFLFDFARITKISYGHLRTDLGNEFSEHVLFYTVMNKCFADYGTIRLTGAEIKTKMGSGEPDYYIRNRSDIFLFEFKDLVLPANVKYSGDAGVIKRCLMERLEKNTEGKQKGISQLLTVIHTIKNGLYKEKNVDQLIPSDAEFYPILVHTDIALESYGINYVLNQRMRELIIEHTLADTSINDLIVVHLDTLLLMQDYFRAGKLNWAACVKGYHAYTSAGDPLTATFPFDEYLKHYFTETTNEKIGHPKDLAAIIASFSSKPREGYSDVCTS